MTGKNVVLKNGSYSPRLRKKREDTVFRLVRETDIKRLARLEAQIFPEELYGRDVLTARHFRHLLKRGNALIVICERAGQLAAYAILLFKKNSDTARIYSIAVAQEQRGQRIAGRLMDEIETLCAGVKAQAITLETREDNAAMQALCDRSGFEVYHRMAQYYHDGQTAIKYKKSLGKGAKNHG